MVPGNGEPLEARLLACCLCRVLLAITFCTVFAQCFNLRLSTERARVPQFLDAKHLYW